MGKSHDSAARGLGRQAPVPGPSPARRPAAAQRVEGREVPGASALDEKLRRAELLGHRPPSLPPPPPPPPRNFLQTKKSAGEAVRPGARDAIPFAAVPPWSLQRMTVTGKKKKAIEDKVKEVWEGVDAKAMGAFIGWAHDEEELDLVLGNLTLDEWWEVKPYLDAKNKEERAGELTDKAGLLKYVRSRAKPAVAVPEDYDVKTHAAPGLRLTALLGARNATFQAAGAAADAIVFPAVRQGPLLELEGEWEKLRQRPERYAKAGREPTEEERKQWTARRRELEELMEAGVAQFVEAETQRREEEQKKKAWKATVDADWKPAEVTFNTVNPGALAKSVFGVAYDTAIAKIDNSTLGGTHKDADIQTAVGQWQAFAAKQNGQQGFADIHVPRGQIDNQQKVLYIQDKSKRQNNPDPTRERQSDFILEWRGAQKNVHVNADPASRADEVKWTP